jgi:hypothetical protein
MQLHFFQILLVGVAVLFLLNGLWKFIKREKGQSFFKVLYTTVIWGGIIFLALFPDMPRNLSIKLGLGESLNALIFLGFVLVFMAIFKLLNSIEKVEQTISGLIRQEALKGLDEYTNSGEEKSKKNN